MAYARKFNFKISARDQVFRMVSRNNPDWAFKPADFTIGVPQAVSTGTRNTSVVLTAAPGGNYEGTDTVYYNRLQLEKFFPGGATLDALPLVVVDKLGDYAAVLTQLNTDFELLLSSDDVVLAKSVNQSGVVAYQERVTVKATPTSLAYMGTFDLVVKQRYIPLADVITTTQMSGLDYPDTVAG